MVKHTSELRMKIASSYLAGDGSYGTLSRKYGVEPSLIRTWVKRAEVNGLESLMISSTRRTYTAEFKQDVVSYYLSSNEGCRTVAAKFNIDPILVRRWTKKYQEQGPDLFLPKKKGRPVRMPKKPRANKQVKPAKAKQVQEYEALLKEKDARIRELEIELLISKKVAARYPRFPIAKKHK